MSSLTSSEGPSLSTPFSTVLSHCTLFGSSGRSLCASDTSLFEKVDHFYLG